jgi:hypothetical protein
MNLKKILIYLLLIIILVGGGYFLYQKATEMYLNSQNSQPSQGRKEDWGQINSEFTNRPTLKKSWKNNNFTYQECQKWVEAGLKPDEASFAHWLKKNKNLTSQALGVYSADNLREEYKGNLNNSFFDEKKWFELDKNLRTEEIEWALNQILHSLPVKILPSQQFSLAMEAKEDGVFVNYYNDEKLLKKKVKQLLDNIQDENAELVFIPVWNPDSNLWSLLTYEKGTKLFYHYESQESSNFDYITPLLKELVIEVRSLKEEDLEYDEDFWMTYVKERRNFSYEIPQSGLLVISVVREIIGLYSSFRFNLKMKTIEIFGGKSTSPKNYLHEVDRNFEEFDLEKLRKELKDAYKNARF